MTDLVYIFCEIYDFCNQLSLQVSKNLLSDGKGKRNRKIGMTFAEVMTISIWYHYSGYKTFKDFYTKHVLVHMRSEFPNLVSYERFIELRKMITMPMFIFLATRKLGKCTGISFIDSFKLESCHVRRASSHKTLAKISKKGKTSTGWFYGMKLHIVINPEGEIIAFYITSGNVADNNAQILFKLTKNILGKLFGDKGYIVRAEVFQKLYNHGIRMITKIKKCMQNQLMEMQDKLLLKKRGVIESVGDILKEHLNMEHSRHRSVWGFFLHTFTSLVAYQIRDKKPKITVQKSLNYITA